MKTDMGGRIESLYYSSPVWLQNMLVSALGYRLYMKRYTGRYHQIRALLSEARHWTASQRLAYQNERLYEMVRFCKQNVPYYQKLFAEHGLRDQDITHIDDLHKIPVLDKDTLRKDQGNFRAVGSKPYILQNTSGSTGTPLTLAVDETTYKMAMALVVDHEEFHGVPFGARRATFAGRMVQRSDDLSPPFWRFNRAENQRLYSSYHLNRATFPFYQKDLDSFAPLELIGYPSAISDIAGYYELTETRPQFRPKAIITNSETLLSWQRERIENVFQCPVRDYYGTAEYVVFAGQDGEGLYRVNPTLGITEVLTDERNKLQGDIIATSLTNYCMPLLRYRVGDSATLISESEGNVQTRFAGINGRLDDYIETPDGRRIGRIDHIFKGLTGIKEAQVIQETNEYCRILIVKESAESSLNEHVLQENFHARIGPEMKLFIEYTGQIPRAANGKFKSVVRAAKA
ncbi:MULTISPECIES: phenylacetate--CoA ligase family protein [Marinobacter]|uniref:Capsular polysaccharide biosynthesis protein CapK n=1 Tax=Marinobacter salsuginis TaxID=418719 RepID=A0A5M3PIN6_9GAMM|nr:MULTISPECIES: phenylacetate--CoA ligase family protein [Marinobacter]QTN40581.1 phenylacetate--CoA ligase family protein [Marinobacter salsuginis]GBO82754.1 capsular polysaccharide biosynthesis protein CapK [Marinobacter salsuginis]